MLGEYILIFYIVWFVLGYLAVMIVSARVDYAVTPPTKKVCMLNHVHSKDSGSAFGAGKCKPTNVAMSKREGARMLLKLWSIWPAIFVLLGIWGISLGVKFVSVFLWNKVVMPPLEYGVTGHPVREYRDHKTDKVMIQHPIKPARGELSGSIVDHDHS